MRLILMQFLTLDGVSQGPGAPDEDTTGGFTGGGWLVPHLDDAFQRLVTGWTLQADGFLLGRRTYEAFARDWPLATDPGDEVATQLNGRPKYVAASRPVATDWGPVTVLTGDVAARVAALKQQPGRELQIHGSTTLGRAMLATGLVDELRLVVAPVVAGTGRRLLPDGGTPIGLRLRHHDVTPGGLAVHVYEPTGALTTGAYRTTDRV